MGRLRRVLGEDGSEKGDDGGPLLGCHMSQGIAHPMNAAALMGGLEDLRGGGPEPLVVVSNDELDAPQPRSAKERRKAFQNGSASEAPVAIPSTSRRPSV